MRPATLPIVIAMAALLAAPLWAHADTPVTHYRWKDTAGVVHFSDTIPASALAGGYDIVDNHGKVVRHVERELTPAERRAAATAAVHAAAEARAQKQRQMADVQMLAAYPTEKDLVAYQQAQLHQIQLDIDTLAANLKGQEDALADLLGRAANAQHGRGNVEAALDHRITEQREAVNEERAALVRRRADLAVAREQNTAQIKRYRALRTGQSPADAGGG